MPDQDIIDHLNAALKAKLTGINQYFLHARMLKHQGEVKLADYEYKASIDAMKHADMLVEHVLRLGGTPDLQELGRLSIGGNGNEMLKNDLALAKQSQVRINAAAAFAEIRKDESTAALLHKILVSQQEHIEFLHGQIDSVTPKAKEVA